MTVSPLLFISHSVTKAFTDDMEKVADSIYSFLLKQYGMDKTLTIKELVHMVFIAYYDKRRLGRDIEQLAMHRDCLHDGEGNFVDSANSQEEHTATCILTIGNTRKLRFQCYKDDKVDGEVKVNEGYNNHTFQLTHGSLFVLHPSDEETILREYFDTCSRTFFKHGNVCFGKNGLSIGLVFRTTRAKFAKEVFANTGRLVNIAAEAHDGEGQYVLHDSILESYLSDIDGKAKDDNLLKNLYHKLKSEYFS